MDSNQPEETVFSMSVRDRLALLNSLPMESDIITIRVLKDLRQALGLTEEELQKADVIQDGSRIRFDPGREFNADIPIGKVAKAIIRSTLEDLNRQKKLTEGHLGLWDMFC